MNILETHKQIERARSHESEVPEECSVFFYMGIGEATRQMYKCAERVVSTVAQATGVDLISAGIALDALAQTPFIFEMAADTMRYSRERTSRLRYTGKLA